MSVLTRLSQHAFRRSTSLAKSAKLSKRALPIASLLPRYCSGSPGNTGVLVGAQEWTKRAQSGVTMGWYNNQNMFLLCSVPIIFMSVLDPSIGIFNVFLFTSAYYFNQIETQKLHDFGVRMRAQYGPNGEKMAIGCPILILSVFSPAFAGLVLPLGIFFLIRKLLLGQTTGSGKVPFNSSSTPIQDARKWNPAKTENIYNKPNTGPQKTAGQQLDDVLEKMKNMFKK